MEVPYCPVDKEPHKLDELYAAEGRGRHDAIITCFGCGMTLEVRKGFSVG